MTGFWVLALSMQLSLSANWPFDSNLAGQPPLADVEDLRLIAGAARVRSWAVRRDRCTWLATRLKGPGCWCLSSQLFGVLRV